MKKLLEQFLAKLREQREQANAALAKMAPLEQNEAATQMRWFFQICRETAMQLGRIAEDSEKLFGDVEKEFAKQLQEEAAKLMEDVKHQEEVAKKLVAKGTHLPKDTVDSMVETAKTNAKKEVEDAAKVQQEAAQKITDRRKEAATKFTGILKESQGDKAAGIATEVASAIPDAELAGEDHAALTDKRCLRIKEIISISGVEKASVLASAVRFPAKTDAEFDQHKNQIQELATSLGRKPGTPRNPLAGGGESNTDPANGKKSERPMMVI